MLPILAASVLAAQLRSYDFVVGRWACNGVNVAGKIDYSFTQRVSKVLGGRWFQFEDASRQGNGYAFMTYERKTRVWRYIDVADSGAYSIGTASVWVGNRQTWTGATYSDGSRRVWGRIVFTKLDNRHKREDFYQPDRHGIYRFIGSEVCAKQP